MSIFPRTHRIAVRRATVGVALFIAALVAEGFALEPRAVFSTIAGICFAVGIVEMLLNVGWLVSNPIRRNA